MQGMQTAQQLVLQQLSHIASAASQEERVAAEGMLMKMAHNEGFGMVLLSLLANPQVPSSLRQMAGIILRQHIEVHWSKDCDKFAPPEIAEKEKTELRQRLPLLLSETDSKLQTAVSMSMVAISDFDFPEKWPSLLTDLVKAIGGSNAALAQGVLQCLSIFAEHVSDQQLAQVIPALFPILLNIAQAPANRFSLASRLCAIDVYLKLSTGLLTLGGVEDPAKLLGLLKPTLNNWLQLFAQILASPVSAPDSGPTAPWRASVFAPKFAAARAVFRLLEFFPSLISKHLPSFLKAVWASLTSGVLVYLRCMVYGKDRNVDMVDTEGNALGLSVFILQSFELVSHILQEKKLRKCLDSYMTPLVGLLVTCMELSCEDCAVVEDYQGEWLSHNQEEEIFSNSVRLEAHTLLLQILGRDKGKQLHLTVVAAAQKRLQVAEDYRKQQNPNWWKAREAATWALGNVLEEVSEKIGKKKNKPGQGSRPLNLEVFLQQVLLPDADQTQQNFHLRARAVWCLSYVAPLFVEMGHADQVIGGVLRGLHPESPLAVRLSATRALGLLADLVGQALPPSKLQPILPQALTLVCKILPISSKEALHTSLDTIILLLGRFDQLPAGVVQGLLTPLLQVWTKNTEDHLVTEGVNELIGLLASSAEKVQMVQQAVLPIVLTALAQAKDRSSALVEGAVDILNTIIAACAKSRATPHPLILQKALPTLATLALKSPDHSLSQASVSALTTFLRSYPDQAAATHVSAERTLVQFLSIVAVHLLTPEREDQACYNAGHLVSQLLFTLGSKLPGDTSQRLLRAVCQRLYSAEYPFLVEGLLLVFARLVHQQGAARACQVLSSLGELPVKRRHAHRPAPTPDRPYPTITYSFTDTTVSALSSALQKWVLRQSDIHGAYPRRLTLSALAKLLSLPQLDQVSVQGYPKENKSKNKDGKACRALRGDAKAVEFSDISFSAKVLALLAQAWLLEKRKQEQKQKKQQGGHEEDSEDDMGEDEDDEFGQFVSKLVADSEGGGGREGGGSPFADAEESEHYTQLSSMLSDGNIQLDDEELDELELAYNEEYPEAQDDPLNKIELVSAVPNWLKTLVAADKPRIVRLSQQLSPEHRALLQQMGRKFGRLCYGGQSEPHDSEILAL
eukprot:g56499.t1